MGLPVSTTHVLSSGVGGTTTANHSGLQSSTVRSLAMAWALTIAQEESLREFGLKPRAKKAAPERIAVTWSPEARTDRRRAGPKPVQPAP